jgi:hypothetical protein
MIGESPIPKAPPSAYRRHMEKEFEMNGSYLKLVTRLRDALANLSGVACDINSPEPPALADAANEAMLAMGDADEFLSANQNLGLYDPWQDPIAQWISFAIRDAKNDAQEKGLAHRGEVTFTAARLLSGALSMLPAQMTSSHVDRAEQCARRFGLLRRNRSGSWEFVIPPEGMATDTAAE